MNAYELADEIDGFYSNKNQPYLLARLQNMLRQQADRIRNLEKTLGFKNSGYETINLTPMPEPVAWMYIDESGSMKMLGNTRLDEWVTKFNCKEIPLYTTPQTKPLSDEEIDKIYQEVWNSNKWSDVEGIDIEKFARAIEERHGIK